ncbi:MAG: trypsin-like peptidase domain-containing protein [Deltaproteobacteria bacterium]|nr:trypsin-like peptidase domain-containing protein [Deltaproteobacteria bacterium]
MDHIRRHKKGFWQTVLSEQFCKKAFLVHLFLVVLLGIPIFLWGYSDNVYALTPLVLSDSTCPAVVKILIYREGKTPGAGTGFFINDSGTLITCDHVVEKTERLEVLTVDGHRYTAKVVLSQNKQADLAVLQADVDSEYTPFLPLAVTIPEWPTPVQIVGHPGGRRQKVTHGRVTSVGVSGLCLTVSTSAPVEPGSSGSPVLNSTGAVIGVVKALSIQDHKHAISIITPIAKVRELLEKTE